MICVIPGHIENNHVVPDAPLPETDSIRSVSILLEVKELPSPSKEGGLEKWFATLKDTGQLEQDYLDYLEKKYS
ncbi:MAG TPA: hypothetical protein VGX70_13740 [Gemmataceae bacterium]|jgi:hypothetical protein|nr:hypothetical protein [Gemmataceae bacterium]